MMSVIVGIIGKVVNVSAGEDIMDVSIEKLNVIMFVPYTHGYYSVGKRVGEDFRMD